MTTYASFSQCRLVARKFCWVVVCSSFLLCTARSTFGRQIDTLRIGSDDLATVVIRPGTVHMESFRLLNGNREPNSRTTRTIASGMIGATATWEIKTGHVSADGDTTMSKLIVQQSDLALVHYKVKADADSASITAFDGYMTGWVDLLGQPTVLLERQLPSPVLPVEGQIPWFFPNLPLRNGYHVVIEYFSQWNQGPVYKEVEVLGSENIERENRAVDCWIVDTGALGPPGYRGTTWVEKGTGRVIQSVLKGQPGQMEYWGVDTSE